MIMDQKEILSDNPALMASRRADLLSTFEELDRDDIGLRFQLNEETHQVMVCVINRATQKIIRTIPQEKLINLQANDLLELLAL